LKKHCFTACGKMQKVEQEASGHDFSRADAIEKMDGFYRLRKKANGGARSVRARLQSCRKRNKTNDGL
jgi:hypothetical protein